jgi:Domain of unknown function (DUF4332)
MTHTAGTPARLVPGPDPRAPAPPLPVTKLRGLTAPLRAALRRRRIATCPQLLRAAGLHARVRRYNGEERLARRSPTPEEVRDWVWQARDLPPPLGG